MAKLQANGLLASKIKTLREINIDFLAVETNVYEFGITDALERLHGSVGDPDLPALLGRKLATLCITLNEHPCIRFQASSAYCREIASVLNHQLQQFKRFASQLLELISYMICTYLQASLYPLSFSPPSHHPLYPPAIELA